MTTTTRIIAAPVVPSTGALRPLGLDEVRITGGFWAERQRVNGDGDPRRTSSTGSRRRAGSRNFDLAAAGSPARGPPRSRVLRLRGLQVPRGRGLGDRATGNGCRVLEARFRAVVDRVAAAQESDGYLNTSFGRAGPGAALVRPRVGPRALLPRSPVPGRRGAGAHAARCRRRTARRSPRAPPTWSATVFGADGIQSVCGHAEVEVGLAELGRRHGGAALPRRRRRCSSSGAATASSPTSSGGGPTSRTTFPCATPTVLRGHAVRANYLAAGAVDVAVETRGRGLLDALQRQWDRTIARRTYVTGGQGSHHQDEAFGDDWELPSDRAYSETCAGIASIMFSWRLLLEDAATPRLRRPHRAHALQRRGDLAVGRGHGVLLREHAAPARARGSRHRPTTCRRGRRRRCARRGSRSRAARRTSPAPSRASPPTSPRPTTTACSCTSTRRRRSARSSADGRVDRRRRRDALSRRRHASP